MIVRRVLVLSALVGVYLAVWVPSAGAVWAPPCTSGQVSVSAGRFVQEMGSFAQTVVLTDVSSHRCSLFGYPSVQLVDAAGSRSVGHHGTGYAFPASERPAVVVLAPFHGRASFTFGGDAVTSDGGPCPSAVKVLVRVPHGDRTEPLEVAVPDCPAAFTVGPVTLRT